MTTQNKTRNYSSLTLRTLLFGLLLLCGIATPTKAQELIRGTFTLDEETRFGSTLLPAGHYTVSIEPVTAISAANSRVSVFVRSASKSGPVASVFALASQQGCETPSGLKLLSNGAGLEARSLCLGKQGLLVDFDLSRSETPKIKVAIAAPRP
jgi:hypothetical protein